MHHHHHHHNHDLCVQQYASELRLNSQTHELILVLRCAFEINAKAGTTPQLVWSQPYYPQSDAQPTMNKESNKESHHSLVAASLRGFTNIKCSVGARGWMRLVGTNSSGCKRHTRHLVLCSLIIYVFDAKPLGPNVRCKTDTTPNRTPNTHQTKNLTSHNKESNDSLVVASLRGFANKACSFSARELTRLVGTNLSGCKRHTRHLVEIYLFVSSHG